MKLKTLLVLLLLVASVSMLSCIATSHDIHVEISCEDFQENPGIMLNDFEIEVGDKIYIKLCSNPTTGFKWDFEMSGDNAVKEEGYDFEEPGGDVPGAPGKDIWTFEGAGKGTTVINMSYSQPWDGGIKDEWTYKVTVVVK